MEVIDWKYNDENNSYRICLETSLNFAHTHYGNYFSEDAIALLQVLMALPHPHMSFLSRIITRKKVWVRLASCMKYVPSLNNLNAGK